MKRITGLGVLAIAQSLYAIDATSWNDFAPQGQPLADPIIINENSKLDISARGQQQGQIYGGSIMLQKNLNINFTSLIQGQNQTTTIYQLKGGQKIFTGEGTLSLHVKAPTSYAKSIFNLDSATLTIDAKTHITTEDGAKLFSIFRVGSEGGGSSLTFTKDLFIDVSNAAPNFPKDNPRYRTIFDNNAGAKLTINPHHDATVQIKGDIADYGGTLRLNLTNEKSYFQGKVFVDGGGDQRINLSNKASMDTTLDIHKATNFIISLNSDSIAKVTTNFNVDKGIFLTFNVDHAKLFGDFHYNVNGTNPTAQGIVSLSDEGSWILSQKNTIHQLEFANHKSLLTDENFKKLRGLANVDLRFKDKGATPRMDLKLSDGNRYELKTSAIQGNNGVFRLFGVLNRGGWTHCYNPAQPIPPAGAPAPNCGVAGGSTTADPANPTITESIATDFIQTNGLFNTHYVQVFWNPKNFDKALLNQKLKKDKIIVARDASHGNGKFVGAPTPIGIYNYTTNLKKEEYTEGGKTGWQWVIDDVQRADNSYISRLLDSLFQSQYRVFKIESDTFNKRMGELRDMVRVHGVWLRTKYGRLASKATPQTTPSWDEFTNVSIGYDHNFAVLGGKNFLGVAVGSTAFRNHGIGDDIDPTIKSYYASSRTYSISLYDTHLFDNGLYLDTIAKYYLTDNRFSIYSEVFRGSHPRFFTNSLLGGLEIGKKFRLPIPTPDFANSFYYLRPEAQFIFGFVEGAELHLKDWTNQIVKARLDYNIPANFRLGLMFGREFNKPYIKGDVYLGTNFEFDVNTGGDLRLEDFLDKMTLSHGWNFTWRFNVGTNLILNEYWRLYFELDTSAFGLIRSPFTINGGVRINFGALHPIMPYITPPQEMLNDFYRKDRRTIPEVQNYETYEMLHGKKKREVYKPPVRIDQRTYGGGKPKTPPTYKVAPKVLENKGAPTFVDNPSSIPPPQKDYTRDTHQPILQNTQPRNMPNIKNEFNQGYRR